MKNVFARAFVAVIICALAASCGGQAAPQTTTAEEQQKTPTNFVSMTNSPTNKPTITPTKTQIMTTLTKSVFQALYSICGGSIDLDTVEYSPNGKWIAVQCIGENRKEVSPLLVVEVNQTKVWKIYYNDFAKDGFYGDAHDAIAPFRWSIDEKFLYAVAYSRFSGCCWIGGKYVLLVRLNLDTGEQVEIINGTDFDSDLFFSFAISENDRFILATPLSHKPYDFTVQDLQTQEIRYVKLDRPDDINLEFAVMSPYEDIIVLPLFRNIEYNDYEMVSLYLINLNSMEQKIVIPDLSIKNELYPIRWLDAERILVSNEDPYRYHYYLDPPRKFWSVNINTGERENVINP